MTLFAQRATPPDLAVEQFLVDAYEWSLLRERLLQGIDRGANRRTLSGGEWMRVRLAGAIVDDFLILDEPTNDLDRDGVAFSNLGCAARSGQVYAPVISKFSAEMIALR